MGATNYQMFFEIICLLSRINQPFGFCFFFLAFLWQKAGKEKSRLSVSMSVVHFHPHIFLSKIIHPFNKFFCKFSAYRNKIVHQNLYGKEMYDMLRR